MQDFRGLKVSEQSHALTLRIYEVTARFPDTERYGLTSQMRRCCASIPANIAEGCGRGSPREFLRFLRIASGSAHELEYFLILSRDLQFIRSNDCEHPDEPLSEIRRMLAGLMRKLKSTVG